MKLENGKRGKRALIPAKQINHTRNAIFYYFPDLADPRKRTLGRDEVRKLRA